MSAARDPGPRPRYPGWLSRLLTHPVQGLENYQLLLDSLTKAKGAIKV